LLGLSSIIVPWDTLITSVVLYIVIPVVIAQLWRKALLARGQAAFDATLAKIGPWSITALLATLVLLFGFQGEAILAAPRNCDAGGAHPDPGAVQLRPGLLAEPSAR
jgi:ACR3 family arsenite transporter